MEFRRALLLFAIVLGLAAVVTTLSTPQRTQRSGPEKDPDASSRTRRAPSATAMPRPRVGVRRLAFTVGRRSPATRRLKRGSAAELVVRVPAPGEINVSRLGLSTFAEPLTPARVPVFGDRPGRYRVSFRPHGARSSTPVGTLAVSG